MLRYVSLTNLNVFKILQIAKKNRISNNKKLANQTHIYTVLLVNRHMAGMNDR